MIKREVSLVIAIILLNISLVSSLATHVISNSEDWRDVYSSILYANLKGIGSDFLVSTRHATTLLPGIGKSNEILVVSSKTRPFVFSYSNYIESQGFKNTEEIEVTSANLELIENIPEINSFIIIGDNYGYDAVAVAPYALKTKSWVFLTDSANIAEIDSIISEKSSPKVLVYGYLDRDIRQTLQKYNPKIIDTQDRFKNNIEIVKEYQKINPQKQVILTNGEFIEKEILSGVNPVLFTGKENVPDQIRDYIKESDIEIGVLIGNDLVNAATNIRRTAGISVIVKFARGSRVQTDAISTVEGLDLFQLPVLSLLLDIDSINYNRANSNLEVTYKSDSNVPIYFKGTITAISSNSRIKVGDTDPIFIAPNDYKTINYGNIELSGENLSAEVYTIYGESPTSLEKILEKSLFISSVNILDKCEIELKKLSYNKQKKAIIIKVENSGPVDCYVDLELSNMIIDNLKTTLGTTGSTKINTGKSKKIEIKQELTEDDIEKNSEIQVIAYFGERENNLVKELRQKFPLTIETLTMTTYAIILLILIILVLIIIILLIKRRRDKEEL
ncbi:MAG: hypothetical protein ACP5OG_05565 [Candidatus Nanoarchaeia archaeon]